LAIARRANNMHCNRVLARPTARVAVNSDNFMQRVISCTRVRVQCECGSARAARRGSHEHAQQLDSEAQFKHQCPNKSDCFLPVSSNIAVIEASRFL